MELTLTLNHKVHSPAWVRQGRDTWTGTLEELLELDGQVFDTICGQVQRYCNGRDDYDELCETYDVDEMLAALSEEVDPLEIVRELLDDPNAELFVRITDVSPHLRSLLSLGVRSCTTRQVDRLETALHALQSRYGQDIPDLVMNGAIKYAVHYNSLRLISRKVYPAHLADRKKDLLVGAIIAADSLRIPIRHIADETGLPVEKVWSLVGRRPKNKETK